MAGAELATEGFPSRQVGSSAMPHKIERRSANGSTGFCVPMRGYLAMVAVCSGEPMDNEVMLVCVSCGRVAIPDAFLRYRRDRMETFLTCSRVRVYSAVIGVNCGGYLRSRHNENSRRGDQGGHFDAGPLTRRSR